jgi:hypothetical protein
MGRRSISHSSDQPGGREFAMSRETFDDAMVYRAALRLANRRGETAAEFAARQAQSFLEVGNVTGAWMWFRLLTAVHEVQRGPRKGETIH